MNKNRKICLMLLIMATLIVPSSAMIQPQTNLKLYTPLNVTDFDPLVDNITVTMTIKEIRTLKTIDLLSNPDFLTKN